MILLQLSAAKGPAECALAVTKAMKRLQLEAEQFGVNINILETVDSEQKGSYKSVVYSLQGEQARALADAWSGSMRWVCPSPYRPDHKRKNWYFGGEIFELAKHLPDKGIEFSYCRASGAGGQHVNKTDSAVRATHIATGIRVKVSSQRSQIANKKAAIALIHSKLNMLEQTELASQKSARFSHHQAISRGNVKRTFKGVKFL